MGQLPSVTVIMPVRNERAYIERSLGAVLAQDYPAERMDVLVVDGMSDDGTRDLVQTMGAADGRVRLIDNPAGIVPPALNLGIAEASGDIVVRVDGHCEIAPDYVSRCVQHLEEDGVDGVGGPIETVGETTAAQAIALAMSSWFGVGGSAFRTIKDRPMLVETVAFPAYRQETLRANGPFDEELVRNQDDEYNYRLLKHGGKILLSPDIRSRYYSRSGLRKLWRQYYQYGFWKVRVMQKHPRQMRWRQFVPAVFVGAMAAGVLLSVLMPPLWLLVFMALAAYTAANWAASMALARRNRWAYLPYLLLAHPILHVSYGAGFLVGLVHFADRFIAEDGRLQLAK